MSPPSGTDNQKTGTALEAGPYEPAVSTKGYVWVSIYILISVYPYI